MKDAITNKNISSSEFRELIDEHRKTHNGSYDGSSRQIQELRNRVEDYSEENQKNLAKHSIKLISNIEIGDILVSFLLSSLKNQTRNLRGLMRPMGLLNIATKKEILEKVKGILDGEIKEFEELLI